MYVVCDVCLVCGVVGVCTGYGVCVCVCDVRIEVLYSRCPLSSLEKTKILVLVSDRTKSTESFGVFRY